MSAPKKTDSLAKPPLQHQTSDMDADDEWGAAADDDDAGDDGGGWDDEPAEPKKAAKKDEKFEQLADQIPAGIRKRVIDDLDELALCGRFVIGPIAATGAAAASAASASASGSASVTVGSTPGHAAVEFTGGNRIHLRVGLPVRNLHLDPEQARAWTLDLRKIIVVDLVFPPDYFNSLKTAIKIKVGQAIDMSADIAQGFRLSWTLEKRITNAFLNALPPLPDKRYDLAAVRDVIDVTGAKFSLALRALLDAKGDVTHAVHLLNNDQKRAGLVRQLSNSDEPADAKAAGGKDQKDKTAPPSKSVADLMKAQNVSQALAELAYQLEPSTAAATALLTNEITREQLEDIVRQSALAKADAAGPAKGSNSLIKLFSEHNYLVRLMVLVESTLATCNKNCMACGDPLVYVGLKPTVCAKDVCRYGFEDLGAGFDLSGEIAEQPQVVDLLITCTVTAVAANRMHFVTPTNVKVTIDGKELDFLTGGTTKELDLVKLKATLDRVPAVSDMQQWIAKGALLDNLKKIDPLLAPLLRWIIGSNRAHIRQLLLNERIKGMLTDNQFVFLSASPDKEARFQALKKGTEVAKGKDKGSILAWHGSATGNWHSILRTGLKNMSNSKYMENGAAYGQGIYLAADSGTSLGYCRQTAGWARSMFGAQVVILSLCEIVNHSDLKPITSSHPYHVVPVDDWVATRYLFVFGKNERPNVVAEKLRADLPALAKTGIEVQLADKAKADEAKAKKEQASFAENNKKK